MKINEVERLSGVSKKNIRFYEEAGLLAPGRDPDNGYRDYGPADVQQLLRVLLMRKLGVPLAEIRAMQAGRLSVGDGMRRHIIALEREKENLTQAGAVCRELADADAVFGALDARTYLDEMDRLEKKGVSFLDVKTRDTKRRKLKGAWMAAGVMVLLMLAMAALYVWLFTEEMPPWPLAVLLLCIPLVICTGVVLALRQRIKEIKGGEEDAADQY